MKSKILIIIGMISFFAVISISFAYADLNDPAFIKTPLRSDQLPCNIGPSPDDDYFQYQCEWIESPRGYALDAIMLFQSIHGQVKLDIKTLKLDPLLHEFVFTAYDGANIEMLTVTRQVNDNTNRQIMIHNGTIQNPALIGSSATDVLEYLEEELNYAIAESKEVLEDPVPDLSGGIIDCIEGFYSNGIRCVLEPKLPASITIDILDKKHDYKIGDSVNIRVITNNYYFPANIQLIFESSNNQITEIELNTEYDGNVDVKFNIPSNFESGTYDVIARSVIRENILEDVKTIKIISDKEPIPTKEQLTDAQIFCIGGYKQVSSECVPDDGLKIFNYEIFYIVLLIILAVIIPVIIYVWRKRK